MSFLIDPDVFYAAEWGTRSQAVLSEIVRSLPSYRFVVDGDEIESEYLTALRSLRDNKEHPAVSILMRILDQNSDCRLLISSNYESIRTHIDELGCQEPVEPRLLGVVANAKNSVPTLLLIGASGGRRPRGMCSPDTLWAIQRKWPLVDVRFTDEAQTNLGEPITREHASHNSKAFETMSAIHLQAQDRHLRCEPAPPRNQIENEQIDIFGYRNMDNICEVVVGECKLRAEGNEARLIEGGEVKQLHRKALAIERYFSKKRGDFLVKRWMISNATGFDDDAKLILASLGSEYPVEFWKAELTSGWSRQSDWSIRTLRPEPLPSSEADKQ